MKNLIPWALSILSLLTAYILHLQSKNKDLKKQVAGSKAEADLRDILTRKEIEDVEAKKAIDDYTSVRDKYLREHTGDGAGENEV